MSAMSGRTHTHGGMPPSSSGVGIAGTGVIVGGGGGSGAGVAVGTDTGVAMGGGVGVAVGPGMGLPSGAAWPLGPESRSIWTSVWNLLAAVYRWATGTASGSAPSRLR